MKQAINRNNRKKISRSIFIWLCGGIFYLYELILRAAPSVMTHGLMQDFGVSAASLGILSSCYYYAYVLLQIPCGLMVDRFGPRFIITVSSVICTGGAYLFGHAENLWIAQAARFLLGAGSACAFIGCLKLSIEWFKPKQFALMVGLTNMLGTLGGVFSGPPLAALVENVGWREATTILTYIGIFVTILCWMCIRNENVSNAPPNLDLNKTGANFEAPLTSFVITDALKRLVRIPIIIWSGVIGGLLYVPLSVFSELWGVPFLAHTFNIPTHIAAYGGTMVFLGVAIGGPFMGRFAAQFSVLRVMEWSAALSSLLFLIATIGGRHLGFNSVLCVLLLAGMTTSGQVLCFALIRPQTPHGLSGTAIALTNAIVMLSGIIFQPLLGVILDLQWNPGDFDSDGVRIYTHHAYEMAIYVIPICLITGGILLRTLRKKMVFSSE